MPRKQVNQPIVIDSLCKHKEPVHITFCGRPAVSTGVVNLRILFGMCGFVLVEENNSVRCETIPDSMNNNDNCSMYKLCRRVNKSNHDCFMVEEGKSYWVAQIDEALTREWLMTEMSEMENKQEENTLAQATDELATFAAAQISQDKYKLDYQNTHTACSMNGNTDKIDGSKKLNSNRENEHDNKHESCRINEQSRKHRSKKTEKLNNIENAKSLKLKRHRRTNEDCGRHRSRIDANKEDTKHDATKSKANISTTLIRNNSQAEHELENTLVATSNNESVTISNGTYEELNNANEQTKECDATYSESQCCHTELDYEEKEPDSVLLRKATRTEEVENMNVCLRTSQGTLPVNEKTDELESFKPTLLSSPTLNALSSESTLVLNAHKVQSSQSDTPSCRFESQTWSNLLNGKELTTSEWNDNVTKQEIGCVNTTKDVDKGQEREIFERQHHLHSTAMDCSTSKTLDNEQHNTLHDNDADGECDTQFDREQYAEINLHEATPLESPALMFTPVYNQLSAEFSLEPSSASSSEDEFERQHHHYSHYSGMHRKYLYDDQMESRD